MKIYLNKYRSITAVFVLIFSIFQLHAQTIIKAGDVNGKWTKKGSPYQIKGDINIPSGATLTIESGAKIEFQGLFKLNVQGSLIASGNKKDSIIFTIADTIGINSGEKYGWNGIRFDCRPMQWDTIRFKMHKNEKVKAILQQRINEGKLDTTTRISLSLKVDDIVDDTILCDSLFKNKQQSQLDYCLFEYATAISGNKTDVFGGAIYIYRYSNLIISNCSFINSRAYAGGAIYCKEAAPIIQNNFFIGCNAASSGGAMAFINSGPFIFNNRFSENTSGYNGGAVFFYESNPFMLNNFIINNIAYNCGGGIYVEKKYKDFILSGNYQPVKDIKFKRDTSVENAAINTSLLGNPVSFNGKFVNNIVCVNTSKTGGGIGLFASAPEIINNTICNNTSKKTGSGICCYFSAPYIINSIIYGNNSGKSSDQVFLFNESAPLFNYCDIEAGRDGILNDTSKNSSFEYSNNIEENPLFNNIAQSDYSLRSSSACIDAGLPDITDLKIAMIDNAGKNRINNHFIDMGALEYTGIDSKTKSTEENQPGDLGEKQLIAMVYPNPNEGLFTITLHNNTYNNLQISVIAHNGQVIYLKDFYTDGWFEEQININDKSPGIYILQIKSQNHIIYRGEIVKEN